VRSRAGLIVAAYAVLAVLLVPVFPHFLSPNELTRWATAASIVERRTPEISGVSSLLGPSFEDVSMKDGRLYSNKAPGLAFVSLPGYLAARPFAGPPSAGSVRPSLYAMRLVGSTLPVLLLAALFLRAGGRLGGETSRAPLVLGALLFGTPLFAYGLLLFSHALVAFALFGAWVTLFVPASPREAARREVASGALLGLAVLSEYPAVIPGLVIVVAAAWKRDPRRLVRVALGGMPFAAALLIYNRVCFGGFLELSSAHERLGEFRTLAGTGLFGVGLPSPGAFLGLLADPSKGLLVFSPFLVLWPRAFLVAGRVLSRPAAVSLGLVPAVLLLLFAGYPNWHGGFTVGPRYLVAALPFLLFPFFFRGGGRLEAGLLGASVAAVTLTSLAFPFVPAGFPLPWGTFALHFFERGLVIPNVFHFVWKPLALAVPFAIVGLAALLAVASRWRFFLFAAAVFLGSGIALEKAAALGLAERLERAYIEDVYFGRTGTLEKEIAATGVPQPRLLARRDREWLLPPPGWPF
jgi:hypothetical protein